MSISRSVRTYAVVAFGLAVATWAVAAMDPARTETWHLPKASLYTVASHGENVWAAGYWGTILRSNDGGRNWQQSDTPTSNTLYAIAFADDRNGFAVGASGIILHSTDGGATWAKQVVQVPDETGSLRPLDVNLFGVAALSGGDAFIVGDLGTLLRTRDGTTWEKVTLDAATYGDENVPDRILNAVVFTSPMDGWIGGEFATLLRTHDGGATWVGTREISGAPPDLYLFGVAGGGGSAAAVGLAGGVLVSNADGSAWTSRSVDTTAGLFSIAWRGQTGITGGDRGVLFITSDGGTTWKEPNRPKLFNWIASTTFVGEREAVAVGEGGLILRSEDDGATWKAAAAPASAVEPNVHMGGEQKAPAEGGTETTH
ncbi:MAG TPA: YCF48-related protein [Myxococcota bacterium]|nr:YCF48-related protein [Myxococcota bacterium]